MDNIELNDVLNDVEVEHEEMNVEELSEDNATEERNHMDFETTNVKNNVECESDDTLTRIAYEVKGGQYGTGETLLNALKEIGVDYKSVMAVVKTL